MPKVSKLKLYLASKYGEDYEIWYNAKDMPKFSIKGLPSDFSRVTEVCISGYETENDLSNSIHVAVRAYKEFKESRVKVIIYRASASAEIAMLRTDPLHEGSYCGKLKGVSEKIKSFSYGSETASFGISYKVMFEIDKVNVKVYHNIQKDGSMGFENKLDSGWQVMIWTEERELFFSKLYDSMRDMVLRISTFIDVDPDKAARLIETNAQQLLK